MNRQEHLMVIAMEECAEVSQRISKALRFGMSQVQKAMDDSPEKNPLQLTNRDRIIEEYRDLRAVLGMMDIDAWDNSKQARAAESAKVAKVERYLKLSQTQGTLDVGEG